MPRLPFSTCEKCACTYGTSGVPQHTSGWVSIGTSIASPRERNDHMHRQISTNEHVISTAPFVSFSQRFRTWIVPSCSQNPHAWWISSRVRRVRGHNTLGSAMCLRLDFIPGKRPRIAAKRSSRNPLRILTRLHVRVKIHNWIVALKVYTLWDIH